MVPHMDISLSLPKLFYIVVWSSDLDRANDLFCDLGVCVVTDSRFFGGFVGEQSLATDFISDKVKVWCI